MKAGLPRNSDSSTRRRMSRKLACRTPLCQRRNARPMMWFLKKATLEMSSNIVFSRTHSPSV